MRPVTINTLITYQPLYTPFHVEGTKSAMRSGGSRRVKVQPFCGNRQSPRMGGCALRGMKCAKLNRFFVRPVSFSRRPFWPARSVLRFRIRANWLRRALRAFSPKRCLSPRSGKQEGASTRAPHLQVQTSCRRLAAHVGVGRRSHARSSGARRRLLGGAFASCQVAQCATYLPARPILSTRPPIIAKSLM